MRNYLKVSPDRAEILRQYWLDAVSKLDDTIPQVEKALHDSWKLSHKTRCKCLECTEIRASILYFGTCYDRDF
jgi:hypothetical protein